MPTIPCVISNFLMSKQQFSLFFICTLLLVPGVVCSGILGGS